MNWRNSSVIVLLILANYVVFGALATFVFPPTPLIVPTRVPKATFTRGVAELRNVGTLTYDWLTPTVTPAITATVTITATGPARTGVATTAATNAARTVVPTKAPATAPATKAP